MPPRSMVGMSLTPDNIDITTGRTSTSCDVFQYFLAPACVYSLARTRSSGHVVGSTEP